MSVTNQYAVASSNQPEWLRNHPILILGFTFLMGLLLGIGGNSLMTQQGSQKQLAEIRAELHKSGRAINRLAGYESTVSKTNTLLANLKEQQRSLASASNDLRNIGEVNRELQMIERHMDQTGRTTANMASLLSTINEQTDLVSNQARGALATIQDLQVIAIDQQFAIPELQNALTAQEEINEQINDLGDKQDIAQRSLAAMAENQERIQELSVGIEDSFSDVNQVSELLSRHTELEDAMRDFNYVLNGAEWLAADAREVQDLLAENRADHRQALTNLDELIWMSEYLGMQNDSLAQAQDSLSKIDMLQEETDQLETALGELVDVVQLVTGVNAALSSVSDTAVQIRQDLAEIVLLQPAVRQIYAGLQEDIRGDSSEEVVDAKARARALIHASHSIEPETKDIGPDHKEILTSH